MDSRSLTLRRKRKDRPTISAPQNATGPGITPPAAQASKSGNNLSVPRDRNAPTETSDLVKRRYSTRYNQLPDFSKGDAPPVPSLPGNLKRRSQGGSPRRPGTASSSRPLVVDPDVLRDPNLQHEQYVTELLSTASEQDIQEYQTNLQRLRNRNSADLQQSVYQNRTQFIKISKEAEKLESEMTVLQNLMSELKSALGQEPASNGIGAAAADFNSSSLSRRNTNRSSVANLEQMWTVQLQALWKNIEKSQKFLPAAPGRHIVAETGNWIELDSATWKPKRPVQIVLLNDHLLVASRKRKRIDPNAPQQGPAPTKLVAEECWALQDIDIIDMATTLSKGTSTPSEEKAIASALTIKSGGRALTYRHEKRDERAKNGLLMALRKASEDVRKATQSPDELKKAPASPVNLFAVRDSVSTKGTDRPDITPTGKDKDDMTIEVDGRRQNMRWVDGELDELDIQISLQHFDKAVEKIEKFQSIAKGITASPANQEQVVVKVDERASRLAAVLCRDLVQNPSFTEATKTIASYLIRLGFEDRARKVFLEARSETLAKRASQCTFEGDLHRYIFSITYVYFTIIKNTVLIYQASFTPKKTSPCSDWAKGHLETLNTLLVLQLSAVEKNGKLWRECMDVVWEHEREMLGAAGIDYREIVGRDLEVHPVSGTKSRNPSRSREQGRSKSRTRKN